MHIQYYNYSALLAASELQSNHTAVHFFLPVSFSLSFWFFARMSCFALFNLCGRQMGRTETYFMVFNDSFRNDTFMNAFALHLKSLFAWALVTVGDEFITLLCTTFVCSHIICTVDQLKLDLIETAPARDNQRNGKFVSTKLPANSFFH